MAAASPSSPAPSGSGGPASCIREKLPPERVALMRDWVECTTRSFRRIGRELDVAASTVSRYAAEGGWTRPAGAALPPALARRSPEPSRAGHRREQIVERLWALAERHAEVLQNQPIERAERTLRLLARLTRTLGEMDRYNPPCPASLQDEPASAPEPPSGRSIHELRDELEAHLNRIMEEEGHGWEVWEWWFEDGAGI